MFPLHVFLCDVGRLRLYIRWRPCTRSRSWFIINSWQNITFRRAWADRPLRSVRATDYKYGSAFGLCAGTSNISLAGTGTSPGSACMHLYSTLRTGMHRQRQTSVFFCLPTVPLLSRQRYNVTFALWHGPSVCRLFVVCRLSVTLLRRTQRFEIFDNILHNLIA